MEKDGKVNANDVVTLLSNMAAKEPKKKVTKPQNQAHKSILAQS